MGVEELSQDMLAQLYGWPVHSLVKIVNGVNKTFRVESARGTYFLRLYRLGRSQREISVELAALASAERGVARPAILRGGDYVFRCTAEGTFRDAVLFEEAPGVQPEVSPENLRLVASELALLHNRMRGAYPIGRPFDPAAIFSRTDNAVAKLGPDFEPLRVRVAEMRGELLASLSATSASHGVCHGDLWPGNLRLLGRQVTFFDFEDCNDGLLVADLARLLNYLWTVNPPEFGALAAAVLDGYQQVTTFGPDEWRLVPCLAQLEEIGSLGFLAFHCTMEPALWAKARARSAQTLDDWSAGGRATQIFTDTAFTLH